VSRGQRGGSPTVVNLSFLDRTWYLASVEKSSTPWAEGSVGSVAGVGAAVKTRTFQYRQTHPGAPGHRPSLREYKVWFDLRREVTDGQNLTMLLSPQQQMLCAVPTHFTAAFSSSGAVAIPCLELPCRCRIRAQKRTGQCPWPPDTSHSSLILEQALIAGRPVLWPRCQTFRLQSQRFRVRLPDLRDFVSSTWCGTGSNQPREDK
jgi:hypothetical protein